MDSARPRLEEGSVPQNRERPGRVAEIELAAAGVAAADQQLLAGTGPHPHRDRGPVPAVLGAGRDGDIRGGVWLQFSETALGRSHHNQYGANSLFFILRNYVIRVVPRALSGERPLGGPGWTTAVPPRRRCARGLCAMPHVSAYTFVHEWWFATIPCSKVG